METHEYSFRKLSQEEVRTLVEWARQEGWNPGKYDADIFFNTDPEGFVGCFAGDQMIGGGSVISYDGKFGFMGLFIVQPKFRSAGAGTALWFHRRDKLLSRLEPGASIGMDGVVAMQPFYQKGGFEIAFRDERYACKGATFESDGCVSHIDSNDWEDILSYDQYCFGFAREKFMLRWLQQPELIHFKYESGGELKGFILARKADKGYKTGPLFAKNYEAAEALLKATLNSIGDDLLFIDIPVVNVDAVRLVRNFKMDYIFECARMYYGKTPELPVNEIFGITTFELG